MIRNRHPGRFGGAIVLALLLGACGRTGSEVSESGDNAQMPPPAAALYAGAGTSLEERLEQLERHLTAVLDAKLDDASHADLLAAEATTDRLLEEEPDITWLPSGYFVEARLRQIQALADRIVAETRRGVTKELVLEDVAALHYAVQDLRTRLASADNTEAPPPLDSLLAGTVQDDRPGPAGPSASSSSSSPAETTTPEPAPEPPPPHPGGPLGEPVRP